MRGTTQRSRLVSSGSAAPHKVAKSLRQSQWPVMERMDEGMTTTDAVWRSEGGGSGPQKAHPSMSPPAAVHAVSGGGPLPLGVGSKGLVYALVWTRAWRASMRGRGLGSLIPPNVSGSVTLTPPWPCCCRCNVINARTKFLNAGVLCFLER